MATNLKNVTLVIVDNGLFVSFAETLAKSFGRVCHWCPYVSAFPTRHLAQIGVGLEGVEKVKDFWDFIQEQEHDKENTIICILDVHFSDIQTYLKKHGWFVFGCGDAENIELFRWDSKLLAKKLGMDVGPAVIVKGLDALREHLKKNENVWVKVSEFRGIGETFQSKNYKSIKARLDEMQHDMGPMGQDQEFIVEQPIKTAGEVGYDGLNVDGEFPNRAVMGYEKKDELYAGIWMDYEQLPDAVKEVNEKWKPALKAYGCRGFLSTEIRIGEKDKKAYPVDMTMRLPSPPGAAYQLWISNIAEVIYEAAHGRICELKFSHKYAFVILLYSEFAAKDWLNVQYPKEISDYVRLYNKTIIKGDIFIVPTSAKLVQIGEVLGFADSLKEAAAMAYKNAEQVVGDGINVKRDSIPALFKTIKESVDSGVWFGGEEIPKDI